MNRAAEQQRIPEKIRVEERLTGVKELQRFLKEMQRFVGVAERVRIQRLQRQSLRGHVRVLRIAKRLLMKLFCFRVIALFMREVTKDDVRLVFDVVRLI